MCHQHYYNNLIFNLNADMWHIELDTLNYHALSQTNIML